MTYADKLKDPRWQKKRLEILQRDKWCCQICGDNENTLHVHHKYYERGKEPWDYDNKYLVTLCADCHESEGSSMQEYSALFIETFKKSGFFADDLRELASGINDIELLHMPGVVASAFANALRNPELQRYLIEAYFNRNKKEPIPY